MRKWLILLSALAGTTASAAPAWTWVDGEGTVHFSDRPVPGARQVELGGTPAASPQMAQVRPQRAPQQPGSSRPALYERVEITSPSEEETLWNIGATLNVQVRFEPQLQPAHRYDLVYDGERRNLNTQAGSVVLSDVFRGAHTLQVVVFDSAGNELTRSPTRTFYVQQTSVLNPNRANRAN